MSEGKVSAVKFKERTYYVYPTGTKDRILVGNQAQFNAYKQSLQAQRNQLTGPVLEEEIHGPHPIQVQELTGLVRCESERGRASLGQKSEAGGRRSEVGNDETPAYTTHRRGRRMTNSRSYSCS